MRHRLSWRERLLDALGEIPAIARSHWLPVILIVVSVAMTVTGFALQRRADLRNLEAELTEHIEAHVAAIQQHLDETLTVGADFRAYLDAIADYEGTPETRELAAGLVARHPGLFALGWAQPVPAAARAAFEAEMRAKGDAGFEIIERGADDRPVRATAGRDYVPVVFAEPAQASKSAIGFDLASEPARRAALEKARDTGKTAVSNPIPLIGRGEARLGIVAFLPLYRDLPTDATVADRRAALIGFVLEPLRIKELIGTALTEHFAPGGFDEYVFGGAMPSTESLILYEGKTAEGTAPALPDFTAGPREGRWLYRVTVADQVWTVAIAAPPAALRLPFRANELLTLVVGIVVTGSLLFYVLVSARRARELTREIRQREAIAEQLKTASEIVEHSPVMIARFRPNDGPGSSPLVLEYTSNNIRQLGFDPDALMSGRVNFWDCIADEDKAHMATHFREAARNKVRRIRDTFRITAPNGLTHWVEGTMILNYDAGGRMTNTFGTLQDVTETRELAEKLNFTNTVLTTQMENAPNGIVVVGPDRKLLSCNRRLMEMGDFPPEVAKNRDYEAFIAGTAAQVKDPEGFRAGVHYFEEHPEASGHNEIEFADGRIFDQETKPLRDESGTYLGRVWFITDITERRKYEQKLRSANVLLNSEIESSPDGVFVMDEKGTIVSYNEKFLKLWGVPPEVMQSRDVEKVLAFILPKFKHPEAFLRRREASLKHPERRVRDEIELADGRVIEENSAPLPVIDGQSLGRIFFFRDITERKTFEQRLRSVNALLNAEIESSPNAVLVVDDAGKIVSFNERFVKLWDIPPEVIESRSDDRVAAAILDRFKDPDAFLKNRKELQKNPESRVRDELELADGRVIERHSSPLPEVDGRKPGRIFFFRDITDRKQFESELQYRDRVLGAVAEAATALVTAPSLETALPKALEIVGRALAVDRVVVLCARPGGGGVSLPYSWESDAAPVKFDPDVLTAWPPDTPDIVEWTAPLREDKPVMTLTREAKGVIKELLGRLGVKSNLLLPIQVEDEFWGNIGIDDMRREREWTATEINALKTLADAIGASIGRDAARRSLAESEEKFRSLVESTSDYIWETDPEVRFTYVSERVREVLGYDPKELIGISPFQLMPKAEAEEIREQFDPYLKEREKFSSLRHPLVRKDGSAAIIETSGAPIFDHAGTFTGYRGLDRDVTAQVEMQEQFQHRFRVALDAMPIPVSWARLSDGEIEFANRKFTETYGYTLDDLTDVKDWVAKAYPNPEHRERANREWFKFFGNPTDKEFEVGQVEVDVLCKDGTVKTARHSGVILPSAGWALATFIDITEEKRATEKLEFLNMLLQTQIENSPDGILIVDENRKVILFNRRFGDMWKIPRDVVASRVDEKILKTGTLQVKEPEAFYERVMYLYDHPEEAGHDEIEFKDGRVFDRHSAALRDPDGKYLGRIWYFRNITDRKQAEAKIVELARHDGLTGLANRSVFTEAIQQAVARARRYGKNFAVLYLDLDHFKDVNDTLGHPIGDELLRAVAGRLKSAVRETDVIARFGGDEFAVLQADVEDPTDVATLANKLVDVIAEPYRLDGNEVRIGTSVGIDVYGLEAADAETLLAHADVALYRAKAEGRGTYRFYTEAMNREVHERVKLQNELRLAIETNQLFLVYQPQVELATGRILGVEALVRWQHPTRGVLPPMEFIPLAEKSGLIIALGNWVLGTAARQAKKWFDAGLAVPVTGINTATAQFTAGVNVSGQQFKAAGELEAQLASLLSETGLPPQMLELELTESTLMETTQKSNDALARIRQLGVRLAIDDFGTGYSSLDYLRKFPVDRVKIAQEFVIGLKADSGDAVIVRAAIGLAQALGLRVIAEGIETEEQMELLREWGCPEGQGYYFAKPMTADAVEPLLRQGRILRPGVVRSGRARRAGNSLAVR